MRPKKRIILLTLLLVVVAASAFVGYRLWRPMPEQQELVLFNDLKLDLERPDALIETQSLSSLPRELLEIPVLRDVLTEDFIFYYEHNPDRLGIIGSLRRMTYEHELEWQDSLINSLLDEPATVGVWRGDNRKLSYAIALIKRNGLTTLMTQLAKVALDDKQLSVAGLLRVNDSDVPLYQLRYGYNQSLLFASVNDQLLVVTDAGLLFRRDGDEARQSERETKILESLLAGKLRWTEAFGLKETPQRQRITVSADYLAMGYHAFFPAVSGFSLQKETTDWKSYIAYGPVSESSLINYQSTWRHVPVGASACAALPVASVAGKNILGHMNLNEEQVEMLSHEINGPVGVCWYPQSHLYTPLIVVPVKAAQPEQLDVALGILFTQAIGARERNHEQRRFPVETRTENGNRFWQRIAGSNYGQYAREQLNEANKLASSGYFNVTLARKGNVLLFSTDDQLVDKAIETAEKRFPALMDILPSGNPVPLYVESDKLAELLKQEAMASLPGGTEALFRNAAETLLIPKLDALSRYGKVAVTLPPDAVSGKEWQWLPITWTSL